MEIHTNSSPVGGKMKRQIYMEYRKMWNKITGVAVLAMCAVVILHLFIYLNLQYRAIDSEGQIVEGLASYRALREASEEIKGTMDGTYIRELVDKYNNSFDKSYLKEHRGFLGTGGMTKFMVPNYFINYAYYGAYMSNGNDKIGLEYDFLDSEDEFYKTYKETVKEHLAEVNPYTEEQMNILGKKVDKLNIPYQTGYYQGLANLRAWFVLDYGLIFVVLAFALSGIFAKDHAGGITELTLSSKYGKKNNFNVRWIAGNIFIISIYFIFIGVQLIANGVIATLDGWNLPAQMFWFECLHNITVGEGILILFGGGLLGAIVIGNIVMLISIKMKNRKLAVILSAIAVFWILKSKNVYGFSKMFNPANFISDSLLTGYCFVGDMALPYFVIAIIFTLFYVALLRIGIKMSYRKYYID
jgi:hypothetical protein